MRTVELTVIDLRRSRDVAPEHVSHEDRREPEVDDLERPIAPTPAESAPAPALVTYPTTFFVDAIREVYARRPDRDDEPRTGTRVVFHNGSAQIVTESYDEVKAKLASLNN